jgi:hypothetical protein
MKSGVQMNFLERRVSADHALSQLVGMVREATETLTSREQRGVYQLESTWVEEASMARPRTGVWIGSAFAARWFVFSSVMIVLVRDLFARARAYCQRALAPARAAWGCDVAPIFIALRAGVARGGARLRKLRARSRAVHETRALARMHDPGARDVSSRARVARQWLRRTAQRAHLYWLLLASRRKIG